MIFFILNRLSKNLVDRNPFLQVSSLNLRLLNQLLNNLMSWFLQIKALLLVTAPGFKPFTKGTVFRSEMQLRNDFGSWQLWRFVKFLLFLEWR